MARVLIVDDSPIERTILKNCLSKAYHEVVGEAANSADTIELYKKYSPDVVLLDIIMPNDNGLDILRQIMEVDKNAVVIMCTSDAVHNAVITAMQNGAKYFLVKPITKETLLKTVEKALNA